MCNLTVVCIYFLQFFPQNCEKTKGTGLGQVHMWRSLWMDSQRELTNAIIHTVPNGSSLLQCEYGHAAGLQVLLLLPDV